MNEIIPKPINSLLIYIEDTMRFKVFNSEDDVDWCQSTLLDIPTPLLVKTAFEEGFTFDDIIQWFDFGVYVKNIEKTILKISDIEKCYNISFSLRMAPCEYEEYNVLGLFYDIFSKKDIKNHLEEKEYQKTFEIAGRKKQDEYNSMNKLIIGNTNLPVELCGKVAEYAMKCELNVS
jgi:hypothetical protein